jgi:TonB family protein
MFDKLIESEPAGAEFHGRKRYFMVSSVIMGILFTTAVVYSIYASDIGLGTESFYLTAMIAPVEPTSPNPEIERPQPLRSTATSDSAPPSRRENISRVDESRFVPPTTSSVPNQNLSRPTGKFEIGKIESDLSSYGGPARGVSGGSSNQSDEGLVAENRATEVRDPSPPRPVAKPLSKPEPPKSLGVVNGRARDLPKPNYPPAAIALNVQGKVDVQVLIDETGRVVSANAVSGHPLLRAAAAQAGRNARFTPTELSKVPVKVTGVIVYNFTR